MSCVYHVSYKFTFIKDRFQKHDIGKMGAASAIWVVCNENISLMYVVDVILLGQHFHCTGK